VPILLCVMQLLHPIPEGYLGFCLLESNATGKKESLSACIRFHGMKRPPQGVRAVRDVKEICIICNHEMVYAGLSYFFRPDISNLFDVIFSVIPYKPDRPEFPFVITKNGAHFNWFMNFCCHNTVTKFHYQVSIFLQPSQVVCPTALSQRRPFQQYLPLHPLL